MFDPKQLARLPHEIAGLLPEYSQLNRDLLGLLEITKVLVIKDIER